MGILSHFMKKLWFAVMSALVVFVACTKDPGVDRGDDSDAKHADAQANRWMYSMLSKHYLWNDELKSVTPDYNESYDRFLHDLLVGLQSNTEDGKRYSNGQRYLYSYVRRTDQTKASVPAWSPTYGFAWELYGFGDGRGGATYYARVRYVLDGSPAYEAGLRRGTWIGKVNGEAIDADNYTLLNQLYPQNSVSVKINTCTVELVEHEGKMYVDIRHDATPVTLRTRAMEENPVYLDTVYSVAGRKVAYLVYNSFKRGYVDNDPSSTEYEEQLRNIFGRFKSEGVGELVLDLRYNGGGYVRTCQLLASLCVDDALLGRKFMEMHYNRNFSTQAGYLLTSSEIGGNNIGVSTVYVLATEDTASASEMIINGLRGMGLNVVHIGTRTEGKTVGMSLVDKTSANHDAVYEGYKYELWPVTFRICNALGKADYVDGFEPDYPFDEVIDDGDRWLEWKPLGDVEEPMLDIALTLIAGGSVADKIDRTETVRGVSGTGSVRDIFVRPGNFGRPLGLPGGLLVAGDDGPREQE